MQPNSIVNLLPLDDLPKIKAKLLINCTSVGMYPDTDATPVPQECLKKNMAVFDTVYNPTETLLLKQAKEAGCKTIEWNGYVHQPGRRPVQTFHRQRRRPKTYEKNHF